MTSRDFAYWLQGFFEIATANGQLEGLMLSPQQTKMIQDHLSLVFIHEIDPSFPAEQQKQLNTAHSGGKLLARC
jgi:hypothetical protein